MVGEDGGEFRGREAQERFYGLELDVESCGDLCVAESLVACANGGGVCLGQLGNGRGRSMRAHAAAWAVCRE